MSYSSNFQSGDSFHNTPEGKAKYYQDKCKDAKDSAIALGALVAGLPLTGGFTAVFLPFASINCFTHCLLAVAADPRFTPQ